MCTVEDIEWVIGYMDAALPAWKRGEDAVSFYFEKLQDLDGYLIKAATRRCLRQNGRSWLVSPQEIRDAVKEILG